MAAIIPLTDIRATASAAARDAFVRAAANASVADESSLPVDVRRRPCTTASGILMPHSPRLLHAKGRLRRDFPFLPHADLLTLRSRAHRQSIRGHGGERSG
jgi:hypothetical protein